MAYAATSSSLPVTGGMSAASVKLFIAGGALMLAVLYLVMMAVQSTAVYFLTVSELEAKGAAVATQTVRVSGMLVPGTLVTESGSLGIQFQIADATSSPLPVVYRGGQVPDIIGDDIEIIAEGKLGADGTFVASSVLAKCPSRLENAPPEQYDYSQNGSM